MVAQCHSVVRAPAARVTRLGPCGEILETACAYATTESFVDITLAKVYQDRQDALQLNANGDICVDKPKAPILRWYEVTITFCQVDPELFNIVSAEPLILDDSLVPEAVGWCTLPNSASSSNFGLEFWTGTEDEGCDDEDTIYGYGILPRVTQGTIGDVTIANGVINFTVSAITRPGNQWGVGPYNVIINETGANAGLPAPLLVAIDPTAHKCFQWTKLGPPEGFCGCQSLADAALVFDVAPTAGLAAVPRVATFPLDPDGNPLLPGVIDWGDLTADTIVTSGTTANHSYVVGVYTATYRWTGGSGTTYTSPVITVT